MPITRLSRLPIGSSWKPRGAVFLPASGDRNGAYVGGVQNYGTYWSATPNGSDGANYPGFGSNEGFSRHSRNRNYGLAVRLVKDYSNVSTDAATPSAANTAIVRKVLYNGQVLILRNGVCYDLHGRILNP